MNYHHDANFTKQHVDKSSGYAPAWGPLRDSIREMIAKPIAASQVDCESAMRFLTEARIRWAAEFRNGLRGLMAIQPSEPVEIPEGQRPWPTEEASPSIPGSRRASRRDPYYRRQHGDGRIGYSI